MIPTMQEIDSLESAANGCKAFGNIMTVEPDDYLRILAAARRGVEADAEVRDTTWQDHADHWKKRAEKAEAELAALKVGVNSVQAKMDALMMEYCPDEMTPEQVAQPQGEPMMEVPCDEANNYSKILSLLGMEEEGDPVEAVRALVAAQPERVSVPVSDLKEAMIWLDGALKCKSFVWDHDQHEFARSVCDRLFALLAAAQEGK